MSAKVKAIKSLCYGSIFFILFLSLAVIFPPTHKNFTLSLYLDYEQADVLQVFTSENGLFSEEKSQKLETVEGAELYILELPKGELYYRLDFGEIFENSIRIEKMSLNMRGRVYEISGISMEELFREGGAVGQELTIRVDGRFSFSGNDPFLYWEQDDFKEFAPYRQVFSFQYLFYLIISLGITGLLYHYVYLKDVLVLGKNVLQQRTLLVSLSKNDFKVKYAGSYLGFIWAFIQPICTIMVFWFVFQVGFKSAPVSEVPYALWLATGLIPWFYFSDSFSSATGTYFEYSYLVKKVVFQIEILPLVKIISAFFVHLFFLCFLLFLYLLQDVPLTLDLLYLPYFVLCTTFLVVGLSFFTASIVVFFKDLSQIIGIALQFGMWMTPIMWNESMFSQNVIDILKLNPMYYVIDGYRSCFVGGVTWNLSESLYFWVVSTLVLFVGMSIFRRLKVHFADVL